MPKGDLILSDNTKFTIIRDAYLGEPPEKLYVSIGSTNNAKIGDAKEVFIFGSGLADAELDTGDGIIFLVETSSPLTIKYLFFGSGNTANDFRDKGTINLETEEQVTFTEDSGFVLKNLFIYLMEGN